MDTSDSITRRKIKKYHRFGFLQNSLVVLICLLGMGGTLWFFWKDLDTTFRQMEAKPVAAVSRLDNTVRYLKARRRQWVKLELSSVIHDGDIISTAAFSRAKINFVNGETLEISEDSTVLIHYNHEVIPQFELRQGEIFVQSASFNLALSIPRDSDPAQFSAPIAVQTAVLDPYTSASLETKNGSVLKVFQGSGTLSSGGETRRAEAGQSLKTGTDGYFQNDPPVLILSPRNGTRILLTSHGKAPVKFFWHKSDPGKADGILLELSETGSFSSLTGTWYSEDNESAELELEEGTYYWKAFLAPSHEEIDSGRIEIIFTQGPRALFPADASVETFRSGNQEIRFYWTAPEEAEAVLLEVAANSDMSRPRLRQLIKMANSGGGSYVSSEIGPGNWYWRIRPVFPGELSESGAISTLMGAGQSFWRVRPMSAGILADDLVSPVNFFTVEETDEPPVHDRKQLASLPDTLSIPRLVFPPDNYTLESSRSPDLLFSWANSASHNGRIQIADRSDFSGFLIRDEEIYGSNIRCSFLEPGIYYWRIVESDTRAAAPSRLVITPALEAPRPESPKENEKLNIEDGRAVTFSWERKSYANLYRFCLYAEGNNTALAEISSLQTNSVHVYFDTVTAGAFRWTVQGISMPTKTFSGRNGLVSESHFVIEPREGVEQGRQSAWTSPRIANVESYSGEIHSPITLIYPPLGANIPGLESLRSPLEARWAFSEPLANVQLIVSGTSDPASDPKAIIKNLSSSSLTFPPLREGIWYWTIRGDTSYSRGITSGDPFWFNVLPVPLLPSPRIGQPKDRSVIDIEQLTRDKNITFSWEGVRGANAYIFSLYRGSSPPSLIYSTKPEASLSCLFDNLILLNYGNYLWQVEAVNRDRNNVIDQRGIIEQHPFTINIQNTGRLQLQSPENIINTR